MEQCKASNQSQLAGIKVLAWSRHLNDISKDTPGATLQTYWFQGWRSIHLETKRWMEDDIKRIKLLSFAVEDGMEVEDIPLGVPVSNFNHTVLESNILCHNEFGLSFPLL